MSTAPLLNHGPNFVWIARLRVRRRIERAVHDRRFRPPTCTSSERVLVRVAFDGADGAAIGTDTALHLRDGSGRWRRIGWNEIASAQWSRESANTVLGLWTDADGSAQARLPTGERFCAFAAERVSSTQLFTCRVELAAAVSATVTAVTGSADDSVIWHVRLDPGIDLDDPAIASALDSALAEVGAIAGC